MAKKKLFRGGVIPFYIKDGKVMMLFMRPNNPKHGGDRFQIAKGKIEPGEDIEAGAFREASEELGLFSSNIEDKFKIGEFLGRTTVYAAEIKDLNMFGDTTDETAETKWMTIGQFTRKGRT